MLTVRRKVLLDTCPCFDVSRVSCSETIHSFCRNVLHGFEYTRVLPDGPYSYTKAAVEDAVLNQDVCGIRLQRYVVIPASNSPVSECDSVGEEGVDSVGVPCGGL